VKAGHGCIACASHRFWDTKSPFYRRLPSVPGFGVDVTADQIGWGITGLAVTAMAAQVVGDIVRDKVKARKENAETPEPTQSRQA